jgi:hypothetical protein
MSIKLKELLQELVVDFNKTKHQFVTNRRFSNLFRLGAFPEMGKTRYAKGYTINSGYCFQTNLMIQYIGFVIHSFSSTKKIFDLVVGNNWWHRPTQSFEQDCHQSPSIVQNLIAGFLVRNFEINNYQTEITDFSFAQAFEELMVFFENDTIAISAYLSLHGPHGLLEQVQLAENVWLLKADHELARHYGLFYSSNDGHYIDLFEEDYLLRVDYKIHKRDLSHLHQIETSLLKKWFIVPLLSQVGNIEMGKVLRISTAWPVMTIKAPTAFYYNLNRYSSFNKSSYNLHKDCLPDIYHVASFISKCDFDKMDNHLHFSLDRLKKTKAATNINDRVVELALAFEYLINTMPFEVTLQLCIKAVKLYNDLTKEEQVFKGMKKFYDLRSKVVHGNASLKVDDKVQKTVDFAEAVVMKILLRLMQLNSQYDFKQISKALDKVMHRSVTLEELLLEGCFD